MSHSSISEYTRRAQDKKDSQIDNRAVVCPSICPRVDLRRAARNQDLVQARLSKVRLEL
jgi:hypothetical protein